MTARARLPNRRSSENLETRFRGKPFTLTFSRFADGRIAEAFIDPGKIGNDLAEDARDFAILISIALQHGVPLAVLRSSVSRSGGDRPATIAGHALDCLSLEEMQSGGAA
jgi:hypothetical protein